MNSQDRDNEAMTIRTAKTAPLTLACTCLAVFLPAASQALPEDAGQPILGTYDNSLLLLDEGKQVFYGAAGTPAEITQGTLKISGQEIVIERIDGEVKKVSVTGSPALYQQQPAIDQALVTAEGQTIILDYDTQHMSAVGNVRFIQGNDQWTGCQIDYYLESRQLSTPRCADGSQARAILSPRNTQ
jgi:lipopolysaccharide export system protein LptA